MRETNTIHRVIVTWLGVTLLLVQSLAHAETDTLERIEWKKVPIRLKLVVGQEQWIEFPVYRHPFSPCCARKASMERSICWRMHRLIQTGSWCANSTAVESTYSISRPPRMALQPILFKSMWLIVGPMTMALVDMS